MSVPLGTPIIIIQISLVVKTVYAKKRKTWLLFPSRFAFLGPTPRFHGVIFMLLSILGTFENVHDLAHVDLVEIVLGVVIEQGGV